MSDFKLQWKHFGNLTDKFKNQPFWSDRMQIYIDKTDEQKEISFSGSAQDLLKELEINPETVIIAANGALITLDTELSGEEDIKIISVLSGG